MMLPLSSDTVHRFLFKLWNELWTRRLILVCNGFSWISFTMSIFFIYYLFLRNETHANETGSWWHLLRSITFAWEIFKLFTVSQSPSLNQIIWREREKNRAILADVHNFVLHFLYRRQQMPKKKSLGKRTTKPVNRDASSPLLTSLEIIQIKK